MRRLAWVLVLGVLACGKADHTIERTEGFGVRIDESKISAEQEGDQLEVSFVLDRTTGEAPLDGELSVELRQLADLPKVHETARASFTMTGDSESVTVSMSKPEVANLGELGGWVFQYRVKLPGGQLFGRRSVYTTLEHVRMVVSGDNQFVVEQPAVFRVRVLTTKGMPLVGQQVRLTYEADADGATERELDSGKTNKRGELLAQFAFKADDLGAGTLRISSGAQKSSHSILVVRPRRVLLTTDKPLYQPGQPVFIRALAMQQPALKPVANATALIEIEGPQGNKLHKVERKSDANGIVAERFVLARLVNLGSYTISVTMGEQTHSKTFKVDRYTLPKFNVSVSTDQRFDKPGAKITGEVDAQYFFGQPVKDAQVRITGKMGQEVVAEVIGKTGADGHYRFELKPGSGGYADVLQVEAEVTDASGAVQHGRASVALTHESHRLQVILDPPTATLGDDVTVYLMLTDPVGGPMSGEVALSGSITKASVKIPASGVAQVKTTLDRCDGLRVTFNGKSTNYLNYLDCHGASRSIRLYTDKALYAEGDSAKISIVAPKEIDEVSLELLSRNIPVASETVKLQGGKGKLELLLQGAKLRRTLQLRAFAGSGQQTLFGGRLIFVAGNDQLVVKVDNDQQSYRPGASAKVRLQVTDRSGKPTAAALGVQVVDEALFALSEVKPGLERRFFWLEQEEIEAGKTLPGIDATSLLVAEPTEDDQVRARMLFAASGNQAIFPIHKVIGPDEERMARQASAAGLAEFVERFEKAIRSHFSVASSGDWYDYDEEVSKAEIQAFAARWLAGRQDPFGRSYRVKAYDGSAELKSAGMDEIFDTDDDLSGTATLYSYNDRWNNMNSAGGWDASMSADAGAPPPMADGASTGGDGGTGQQPVRQDFPETLYVDPALITDSDGKAEIDLSLADSITSWRLTAIANSQAGQLGSTAAGIKVFQPFFIDVLLPENLLQNDEVTVPVAVYNYLADPQQVTVKVDAESWFVLLDGDTKQVELPARAVSSVKFRVRVKQVGKFGFTARGSSADDNDAVKRQVRVLPDGARKEIVFSGTLKPGSTTHQVVIPPEAIDGSADLFVKVYPGILSEVVEGFESMLREPHGCFEQTSSTTYPNIMVLQYLKQANQVTPELENKAKAYIAQGYQALVGYEVDGGGFSLWGDPPADLTLSAFGLMEFFDMSQVRFVDEALIDRTRQWLLQQQTSSGAWPAPGSSAHSIAGGMHDGEVRGTAYVTWALARSGEKGPAVQKALAYLRDNAASLDDAYSQAVVANALIAAAPGDATATQLLSKLKAAAVKEGDGMMWSSSSQSLYYGYGDSMNIETTALALNALLSANDTSPLVHQGLTYLIKKKTASGGWNTTQSTVLALQVLLRVLADMGGDPAQGTIGISHNGSAEGSATLTAQTSDVTRIFDLRSVVVEGKNNVMLDFVGSGEMAYQVVGVYYEPHATQSSNDAPFDFGVTYDRTELTVGEKLTATATIQATNANAVPQAMIFVGLPPGCTFDEAELRQLNQGTINNVEQKGPHLVFYLGNVTGMATITAPLTATLAIKAKAAASLAYPYYSPEILRIAETPIVTVLDTPL